MRVLTGLLIVALATVVAVGGLVLVQRLVSTDRRKQHNDVAGFIYAVLGVSYAVLLGLMLIAVWEQWNAAQDVASVKLTSLQGSSGSPTLYPNLRGATSRSSPAPTLRWW